MTKFPECDCAKCRDACRHNPGWFLPEEARKAIKAGYAPKMMRDWLEPSRQLGNDDRIYVLAPAALGCEGDDAPELMIYSVFDMFKPYEKGRCVLHTKDGLCEIHASGFKPFQCKAVTICGSAPYDGNGPAGNYEIARAWNTDLGRAVVAEWQEATGEHES